MRTSLFPIHDVCLRHEEYAAMVKAVERAEAIVADRQREEERNCAASRCGRGHAIFRTKDGIEAEVADMSEDLFRSAVLKRACVSRNDGMILAKEPSRLVGREVRTYERTGEMVCGKPVFVEI